MYVYFETLFIIFFYVKMKKKTERKKIERSPKGEPIKDRALQYKNQFTNFYYFFLKVLFNSNNYRFYDVTL